MVMATQQVKQGMPTMEKLALYDDIITDALIDKVDSIPGGPPHCSLMHCTGVLLDNYTQK
jgi:hypothetical protein